MDSTTCLAHLNKCEVQSHKSLDRLDKLHLVEANKQTTQGPITPDSSIKRPLNVGCFDSNNQRNEDPCHCIGDNSPKTSKDGVFDPFAQHGICVDGVETFSDEEMFESVYQTLFDAIVTKQTEGLLAQISIIKWDSDVCKTPPLAPRLNGIAETCPNAPMKPSGKSRNIDLGLCKKLEF